MVQISTEWIFLNMLGLLWLFSVPGEQSWRFFSRWF